jgi:hypothetical protein
MCCGSSAAPTRSIAISKLNTRRSQTGYGFFDQDKTKRPRAGEILCWIFVLCLMLGPWIAWLIGEPYRRNIVREGALCAPGYRWTYAQPRQEGCTKISLPIRRHLGRQRSEAKVAGGGD